jgi:hypothetical protein
MAEPPDDRKSPGPKRNEPPERGMARRRFATAIARAEFGRHYWSEGSERALRAAMAKKPKSKK